MVLEEEKVYLTANKAMNRISGNPLECSQHLQNDGYNMSPRGLSNSIAPSMATVISLIILPNYFSFLIPISWSVRPPKFPV